MDKNFDGGDAIVQALTDLGVEYVISSPGSEWAAVWEALVQRQSQHPSPPRYINCAHETLAVDLALGYTLVTGRMQAVLLHGGVGLMQGCMGIFAARLREAPMIIMSGESLTNGDRPGLDPGSQWYTSLGIVGGPQRLLEPHVKWATQAASGETLYEMVVRAGEIARSKPSGPVYLSTPIEALLQEWCPPPRMRRYAKAPRLRPPDETIGQVASLLATAESPVILTSGAGYDRESYDGLRELAELLAIPVVEGTGTDSVNSFSKRHPLHQGFENGQFLEKSDLILIVRSRCPWYPPKCGPMSGTVVVVDETPFKDYMPYQNLQADIVLEGDVGLSLDLLAAAVRAIGVDDGKRKERYARWEAAHTEIRNSWGKEASAAAELVDPVALCKALGECLPENTIYINETTTHRMIVQRHLEYGEFQSYLRLPAGLGQGVGVALGVKLASPSRPVVLLVGDGAFLYSPVLQALLLSRSAKLPVLIVVFNNRKYAAMEGDHRRFYPEGAGVEKQMFLGASTGEGDLSTVATIIDGVGLSVRDPANLTPCLRQGCQAIQSGRAAILDVHLSR